MYQPLIAPIADSLGLSALLAAVPLLVVFVLLGVLRVKAHWAGLAGLAAALLIAVTAYGMPADLALLSAGQGAAFGVLPILWIVITAIWLYQLTVRSGRFEDLRATFALLSPDPRIQAVVIAFCFGGLLEALAGFGAPVAITGMMLVAIGFPPLRAAVTVLLANTAPVAFGALSTPIITAGELTGIPYEHIGAVVGRQTPLLAVLVPVLLVLVVDGRRGVRQTWPAALVTGAAFAAAQFVCANYISVPLTDIVSALVGAVALVVLLRFWQPAGGDEARTRLIGTAEAGQTTRLSAARITLALFPYLLVIAVFSVVKLWEPAGDALAATDVEIPWPGLHDSLLTASGEPASSAVFTLSWLSTPGSLLLLCGFGVALAYRIKLLEALTELGRTVVSMRWSGLTIISVLALAYVMNQSGQTTTIGTAIAGIGSAFAFFSPVLGWIGVAVTGSDTSANALFASLQQVAAERIGVDPALLVAANTSGGVMGKMVSPQNLAIVATAVGMAGAEAKILREVLKWSIGLLLVLCALVFLQAGVLSWMLPR
ncbi:lactate permease [Saccharopolyspora kobensis]|uniref:L-lactate permease n=2 Tax=Saccharopolyspora kobensis TaxID=146035 RepID=A0A1H5W5L8_9PSEU|nr:L-lactate permease [Saccharopolyspora kobensis]SEF94804.1 lactate permease [Saccharopolyspora kobensis]SFD72619.1 lactate permease [Saccharopolyspora kobensis]